MIEASHDRSLTQELLSRLFADVFGKGAVIFDLFKSAEASFETYIVGEVDRAGTALSDPFPDLVAGMQDFAGLQREGHIHRAG